jgi:hypothetical protein
MTGSKRRAGLRRGRRALVGAVAASAVMAFGASSAQAASFQATFDDAALKTTLPSAFDLLDSPTATLSSNSWDKGVTDDFTGGTLSVPDFSGEALPGVPVSVSFSATSPITGHLDPATGAMTTSGTYSAVVSVFGATCTYTNAMSFSTLTGSPFNGDPFTVTTGAPDTLTNGVLQTGWSSLPPASPAVGDCTLVNALVNGPGGIAMGNGFDLTPDVPESTPATSTPVPVTNTAGLKKCLKKAKKIKDKDKRKKAIKKCKKKFR